MGQYEKANELGILAAGREPKWDLPASYTGAPGSLSAGVYLENALQTLVAVQLRASAHRRGAAVTVDALDLTAVYTVTIDGTAVDYDAGAGGATDGEDVLEGIADAINADPVANLVVSALAEDTDDDGILDSVSLAGIAEADYTVSVSATGTGVLACEAEPSTLSLRLWSLTKQGTNAPTGWLLANGQDYDITYRGFLERFETAGLERMFVELYDVAGPGDGPEVTLAPAVRIGPCVTE